MPHKHNLPSAPLLPKHHASVSCGKARSSDNSLLSIRLRARLSPPPAARPADCGISLPSREPQPLLGEATCAGWLASSCCSPPSAGSPAKSACRRPRPPPVQVLTPGDLPETVGNRPLGSLPPRLVPHLPCTRPWSASWSCSSRSRPWSPFLPALRQRKPQTWTTTARIAPSTRPRTAGNKQTHPSVGFLASEPRRILLARRKKTSAAIQDATPYLTTGCVTRTRLGRKSTVPIFPAGCTDHPPQAHKYL